MYILFRWPRSKTSHNIKVLQLFFERAEIKKPVCNYFSPDFVLPA
jgi:hypothetical protein